MVIYLTPALRSFLRAFSFYPVVVVAVFTILTVYFAEDGIENGTPVRITEGMFSGRTGIITGRSGSGYIIKLPKEGDLVVYETEIMLDK